MIFLIKRDQVPDGWRSLEYTGDWSTYEQIKDRVKSLAFGRDTRRYVQLDRGGRIILSTRGQGIAMIVATLAGQTVAVEMADGDYMEGLGTISGSGYYNMTEAPQHEAIWRQGYQTALGTGRYGAAEDAVSYQDLMPLLHMPRVFVHGTTLRDTEDIHYRPGSEELNQALESQFFEVWRPSHNTVRVVLENAHRDQENVVLMGGNFGVHFRLGNKSHLFGTHVPGWVQHWLASGDYFQELDENDLMSFLEALPFYGMELRESDLPMVVVYRSDNGNHRTAMISETPDGRRLQCNMEAAVPNDWVGSAVHLDRSSSGWIPRGASNVLLSILEDFVLSYDPISQFYRQTAAHPETFMDPPEWIDGGVGLQTQEPVDLQFDPIPVRDRIQQREDELFQQHLSWTQEQLSSSLGVVLDSLQLDQPMPDTGQTGLFQVFPPVGNVTFVQLDTNKEKGWFPAMKAQTQPVRWILQRKALELGASWDTVRGLDETTLVQWIAYAQHSQEPVLSPSCRRNVLLGVLRSIRPGQVLPSPRAEWAGPLKSFTCGIYQAPEPALAPEDQRHLDSLVGVAKHVRQLLQRLRDLRLSNQDALTAKCSSYLGQATAKGWGALPLNILERVVWFLDKDIELPRSYDQLQETAKKAACAKALRGHTQPLKRGPKMFGWIPLRDDLDRWQSGMRSHLGLAFLSGNDEYYKEGAVRPEADDNKSMVDYGEDMLQLLIQDKLSIDKIPVLAQIFRGFGQWANLGSKANLFLAYGGFFGAKLDWPFTLHARPRATSQDGRSIYESVRDRLVGQAITHQPRFEAEINQYLTSNHQGNYYHWSGTMEDLGRGFFLDEVFREAVMSSTPIKRRLRWLIKKLGLRPKGRRGVDRDLESWPPLPKMNTEQLRYMGSLRTIMFTDHTHEQLVRELGLHEDVPMELIARLVLAQPSIAGVGLHRRALLDLLDPASEDYQQEARDITSESEEELHQRIQRLGKRTQSKVVRGAVNLTEALIMGNLTIGGLGIPGIDTD